MKMHRKVWAIVGLTSCLWLVVEPAVAKRFVVVNGQRLNTGEIQYLERISCTRIPNGRYWLNVRTGIWGYQGSGAQGHIFDRCRARRPSLSERGLLYRPGELLQ
ncbi:MAG: hypothetical protein H6974_02430 [Gammaproteobacteria bacterium]|nr:hypothetical protein [Gammaproteobacteria bacterium]